jgi:hypothetical protein
VGWRALVDAARKLDDKYGRSHAAVAPAPEPDDNEADDDNFDDDGIDDDRSASDVVGDVLADLTSKRAKATPRDEARRDQALSAIRALLSEDATARFALVVVSQVATPLPELEDAVRDAEQRLGR